MPNDTSFCKSIAPLNLANWSKLTKGTFSGPGVENGILVLTDVVDPDNIITISYSENNNGCLFQDQVDITMLSSPNKPTIDGLVEGCDNATLNLFTSKGNNLTYKWFGDNAGTPFSTDQNVNVIVGNVNVVELETINAIGCPSIGRAIVNVVSNNPSVSFTKSKTNLVSGDLITYNYTGSTAQTVFWEFTNGTSANGINPKQFAFSDTIKKVGLKLTATNKGCSSIVSADTAYIVTPKPITVLTKGDANTFSGNNASSYITVYPNPVVNVVHFDLVNEEGEHQLTIYDVLGNQIVSSQLSGKNSIDVSHLNSGSYIATISGSSFNQTFKIIK